MTELFRNGILVGITAQGLIGASVVWDKILLRKPETTNLISYVFWLGAISIFGLLVAVFGFHFPPAWVCALGLLTGSLDLVATYFYYAAIKEGEASGAAAVVGGFSPLATVLIGGLLLPHVLKSEQITGFALLVGGGFLMFFAEHADVNLSRLIPRVVLASGLFGLENVLQKVVFNQSGFVPGFVFMTLGTFAGSMLMLVPSAWRAQIKATSRDSAPRSRFWYFVNRFVNGVGAFLIFYAVSLASPAIVDALSGVRYGVIFIAALGLTKIAPGVLAEDFRGPVLVGKTAATMMVAAGLVLLALGS